MSKNHNGYTVYFSDNLAPSPERAQPHNIDATLAQVLAGTSERVVDSVPPAGNITCISQLVQEASTNTLSSQAAHPETRPSRKPVKISAGAYFKQ